MKLHADYQPLNHESPAMASIAAFLFQWFDRMLSMIFHLLDSAQLLLSVTLYLLVACSNTTACAPLFDSNDALFTAQNIVIGRV